jgi:hypothetical protein
MNNQPRTGFLGSVGRFFFSPTDPTVLGFMRIMTGLIILYTHAAYSLDLKTFLGPHAWWDQEAGNAQRREAPFMFTPLGWEENQPVLRFLDDTPHRRAAEIEFFRNLPSDPHERAVQLRYLNRLFDLKTPDMIQGLNLCNSAGKIIDSSQSAKVREALKAEKVPETGIPLFIPDFIRNLPPDERVAAWDEMLVFVVSIPSDPEKQEYVLIWLSNYPAPPYQIGDENLARAFRRNLYQFLIGDLVIDGKQVGLPADMREREEVLHYYERWARDPRQANHLGTAVFSHWYHLTDPTTMWVVHLATLVVFAFFTVGLFTRVTSVMTWALSLCYIHRGQMSLFGQDTMQTILVTYLMIAPCGAALSFDAIRARYRAARALFTSAGRPVSWAELTLSGPQPSWLANFAVRLFQINFCFIYMSSGISKLKGDTWWNHSAPWLVLVNPEFGLVRYQAYTWLIRQLAESRFLITMFAGGISVFTLMIEIGLPILIWTRLRPVMAIFSAMLHLGIAVIMGLSVFGLYMFTLLLCYFPAALIRERIGHSPGAGRKMTLRYDSRDPSAVRKAALVRAVDVSNQITFTDTAGKEAVEKTIHLIDPDGRQHEERALFDTALRELVLLKPVRVLGYVPGVWQGISAWFGR